jgi:hypothetical protein
MQLRDMLAEVIPSSLVNMILLVGDRTMDPMEPVARRVFGIKEALTQTICTSPGSNMVSRTQKSSPTRGYIGIGALMFSGGMTIFRG